MLFFDLKTSAIGHTPHITKNNQHQAYSRTIAKAEATPFLSEQLHSRRGLADFYPLPALCPVYLFAGS
jgi:hypothetical protein